MKRIQPSVVIGLGGTGVATVTFLKKTILEQAPDIARFVRFLAIDIDELKGEVPSGRLFGKHVRLDPDKNEFYRIVDQTTGSEAQGIPAITSWFPQEGYRYLPLTEGARQAKPIGRLGFFLAHSYLARRLQQLCEGLVTTEVLRDFPGLRSGALNVYIVSSICGGTGAGLFVDVAYELRYLHQLAYLPQKTRIKGLFALGDIYDAISKRVQANTYASLREINWVQREKASYHPIYPEFSRDPIKGRLYDAVYLFSDSNASDIEFTSPTDFAHLCADFIFLDSGADAREDGGDPLSQMMQSTRNNAEVYTMNYDADGTPRCYSALGLCKILFPAIRVAELCAARMSLEIINHHILGRLSQPELLEARRKALEFLANEGLGCSEGSSDLPDRLTERQDGGDRIPLERWVTQALVKAHTYDLENIKKLELSRFTSIGNTVGAEIQKLQDMMPEKVVSELSMFRRVIEQTVARMFKENLGVNFVARFLDELLNIARASRDHAQQELKTNLGQEKRLLDSMSGQVKEMANLLGGGLLDFLRGEARREQLKETYKALRLSFVNRISVVKMRAAVTFYDGVYDSKGRLLDGGEGALAVLSQMVNVITLIQAFVGNLTQAFQDAYQDNKLVEATPFEIVIYDNEFQTELEEVFSAVYSDALRANLFEAILARIGGTIWHLRDLIDKSGAEEDLRSRFMQACRPPFDLEIDRKTVAQRIVEAKKRSKNPRDYGPALQRSYELGNYFCRLSDTAGRFADLRPTEQVVACVVGYQDKEDSSWAQVEQILREGMKHAGQKLPIAHSSDKHSILIYREFSGFPAYVLRRINSYYTNYTEEARRENAPPLQMLTKERMPFIHVPNTQVLTKYEVLAMEGLAHGVIIWDREYYYLVTLEEWRRRKQAEQTIARGDAAKVEDRRAGSDRQLGSTLTELYGRLREKIPDHELIDSSWTYYEDRVRFEIEGRKAQLEPEQVCELYKAIYFNGLVGTERETIDLKNVVQPAVLFILNRDYSMNKDELKRPSKKHEELLRNLWIQEE